LDDIGQDTAKILVNHLKLWADPWHNQPGETKGGQVALIYDTLIVTSNYHLRDLDLTKQDYAALERRFVITCFPFVIKTRL